MQPQVAAVGAEPVQPVAFAEQRVVGDEPEYPSFDCTVEEKPAVAGGVVVAGAVVVAAVVAEATKQNRETVHQEQVNQYLLSRRAERQD